MNTYTVRHVAGEDVITAGSVHYGDWVKFYRESTPNRDLVPVYAVGANSVIAISQADAIVSSSTGQSEVEVPVLMCRSELTTESVPKYTAPANGTTVIRNIVVSNAGDGEKEEKTSWVVVTLGGVTLLPGTRVHKGDVVTFDLEQVMIPGEELAASVMYSQVGAAEGVPIPPTVTLHVSGTETRRAGAGDKVTRIAEARKKLDSIDETVHDAITLQAETVIAATEAAEQAVQASEQAHARYRTAAMNVPVPDPDNPTATAVAAEKKKKHTAETAKLEAQISELQAKIAQSRASYAEDQ